MIMQVYVDEIVSTLGREIPNWWLESLEGEISGILNVSKCIILNIKDVDTHTSDMNHIPYALKFWTKMLCLIAPENKRCGV